MAKKDGVAIINTMVGKFQGIVDGLDKGAALCKEKQGQNDTTIKCLSAENHILSAKVEQAKTFRDNLKDMLTKKPDSESKNKEDNAENTIK